MKIVVIVICNRYNSDTDNSYNNGDIIVITEILVNSNNSDNSNNSNVKNNDNSDKSDQWK